MKTDPLDFWKKYELISSSKKILPKDKSNVCRYCGKSNDEVTFLQDTHLIPELLGENNILTYDECDTCNKLFSGYESNFSIFFRPYITLMGVKGKSSIPAFQSRTVDRNEETRTSLKHIEGNQKQLFIQNFDDYSINTTDKTFDILFRKPPFVPVKIYKTLLKIGLSFLPTEYDGFNRNSFEWLTNKIQDLEYINYAFTTTLKKSYLANPSADLYRAKRLFKGRYEFPEHILILSFANQIVQIFLPFSDELKKIHNKKRKLELNLFPAFTFDKIKNSQTFEIQPYNLGVNHSITEDHKISFKYGSAEGEYFGRVK